MDSLTDQERAERVAALNRQIAEKRQELENVTGRETEVYTRIVGYYRSLKNWNKGKRAEFGDRVLFVPGDIRPVENVTPISREVKRKSFIPEQATFKGVAEFGQVAI